MSYNLLESEFRSFNESSKGRGSYLPKRVNSRNRIVYGVGAFLVGVTLALSPDSGPAQASNLNQTVEGSVSGTDANGDDITKPQTEQPTGDAAIAPELTGTDGQPNTSPEPQLSSQVQVTTETTTPNKWSQVRSVPDTVVSFGVFPGGWGYAYTPALRPPVDVNEGVAVKLEFDVNIEGPNAQTGGVTFGNGRPDKAPDLRRGMIYWAYDAWNVTDIKYINGQPDYGQFSRDPKLNSRQQKLQVILNPDGRNGSFGAQETEESHLKGFSLRETIYNLGRRFIASAAYSTDGVTTSISNYKVFVREN